MIFATVGTQFSFPRLMAALVKLPQDEPIIAQVGPDTAPYPFDAHTAVSQQAFEGYARRARVIVAHAGIGTVLTALKFGKPLILVPRRAAMNEHRNDHQLATARNLAGREGLYVAWHASQVEGLLSQPLKPAHDQNFPELDRLVRSVRDFVTA